MSKKHRRICYSNNNLRQQTLTDIKERKAKAELHWMETTACTNLRQQALTEIKERKVNANLHWTETSIQYE